MSSSDLELARALSRLLSETPAGNQAPAPDPLAVVEPPDPARYVRLRRPPASGLNVPAGDGETRS